MPLVTDEIHRKAAGKMRELLATYERQRDLILLGAYQAGTDPRTDEAIAKIDSINAFLKQGTHENAGFPETRQRLIGLV
jgi:type III secretion protein N (ATPase)